MAQIKEIKVRTSIPRSRGSLRISGTGALPGKVHSFWGGATYFKEVFLILLKMPVFS
jgi:hypothetical protein